MDKKGIQKCSLIILTLIKKNLSNIQLLLDNIQNFSSINTSFPSWKILVHHNQKPNLSQMCPLLNMKTKPKILFNLLFVDRYSFRMGKHIFFGPAGDLSCTSLIKTNFCKEVRLKNHFHCNKFFKCSTKGGSSNPRLVSYRTVYFKYLNRS